MISLELKICRKGSEFTDYDAFDCFGKLCYPNPFD